MRANRETIKRFAPHICCIWALTTLVWLLWPILDSALVADDIPNSQRSAGLLATQETLIDFTFRLTRQWMKNEGRFFPISVFENALIFHTIHSRFLYKLLELATVAILASCLAIFVKLLTSSWKTAVLTLTFFCVAIQVRVWYDPTISFGVLLPSTGIKALVAFCLIIVGIRSEKKWVSTTSFYAASILWSLALMQYEIVLLLGSVAILIALHEDQSSLRKRLIGTLSVIIPSLMFLGISRIIRSGIVASPAYATNLDVSAVGRALRYQLLGGVPLSVPTSGVDNRFGVWGATLQLSTSEILVVGMTTLMMVYLMTTVEKLELRTRLTLFASGLALFILPAIPTSLSVRWQSELGPGHAYLPVMLQYLGTSLLLLTFTIEVTALSKQLIRRSAKTKKIVTIIISVAISLISVLVIHTNRVGIEYAKDFYNGFKTDREIFEAATRRGLIEKSLSRGVLLSASYDPALWVNKEYISWLGGPLIGSIGRPLSMIACRTANDPNCGEPNGSIFIIEHSEDGEANAIFVTLENWWNTPQTFADIKAVRAISLQRRNLICGKITARKITGWWVSDCSADEKSILAKIQAQYNS